MFKKFVFIPPMLLGLLFAAAMAYATYSGVLADINLVEARAQVVDHRIDTSPPSHKIATTSPIFEGTHQGTAFRCECDSAYCAAPMEIGQVTTVLIDLRDVQVCYDPAQPSRPDRWGMSLGLMGLMLLLAGVCARAIRRRGARTH